MINIRLMIYKLFLLALLICNSVEAKDVGKIHKDYSINKQNADSLYNNEKYESAAKTYSYIIENQGIAPELYYNLGNNNSEKNKDMKNDKKNLNNKTTENSNIIY